jgi:hypothetical protein
VALRLHPDREKNLNSTPGAVAVLARKLAHTYHYYLHPDHATPNGHATSANALTQGGAKSSKRNSNGVESIPAAIEVHSRGHAMPSSARSGKEFERMHSWQQFPLNQEPNLEKLYRSVGSETVFRFAMDVTHQDDGGHIMTHAVHGEVRQ